jgi:hypothetical protein
MTANPKPAPEVVAIDRQFPLYGMSRGPLLTPRPQEPSATRAGRDLRAYYQDATKEPAWKAAVGRLAAAEPAVRVQAASYLGDLLDQALKDEQAGMTPWQASPFWDGGVTNSARGLRERVAAALAAAPAAPGALPVVNWFLEREKLARLQGQSLQAATGLHGPDADAFFLQLATKPHPNVEVALAALAQVDARKIKITAEQLVPLCRHHRARIREAARALNARLGFPAPPPFDAARAIRSEPLRGLMEDIGRLVAGPAPPDAPFVLLTMPGPNGQSAKVRGWLLEEDAEAWVLLTPNGRRSRFPKKAERGAALTLEKVAIQDEVDRVVRLRREGDKNFAMSSRGGLSGQFEGHGAGEYEALLAQWLLAGGRYEQPAAVLLPALDTLLLDSHLVDITRDRLGDWCGTVADLLQEHGPDARETAVRVFKNPRLPALDVNERRMTVGYTTNAGLPDGLRFYLRLLETPGKTIGETTYDRPVAEVAAEEVLDFFAPQDRALDEIKKKPALTAEKVAAVTAWAKAKTEKMVGPK